MLLAESAKSKRQKRKFCKQGLGRKKPMREVNLFILMVLASAIVSYPFHSALGTWSIAAVDPATGDVGVAAATCRAMIHIDYVAALVPGKGAGATQAATDLKNRDTVFQLLQEGHSAEDIIEHVSDPAYDAFVGDRQYGVVTLSNGLVRIAAFTGKNTHTWRGWAGSQQDIGMGATVQGNILASEAVVTDAMNAFRKRDAQGYNALPDRLMRALEAGSAAGGDNRCSKEQTAATAFILVARGGDPPYAVSEGTDMGTPNAPWLAISVTVPMSGPNPIIELRKRYDDWRENTVSVEPQAKLATTWGNIKESREGRRS